VGVMLDNFFQQHSHLDFDLMINAIGIHYQLSEESQKMLALAMLHVFQIDENLNQLYVQDFILFTDMISLPEFLLALENG
jgi:hypothetical protein